MKTKFIYSLVAQTLGATLILLPVHADTYMCAKKTAKVVNEKIKIANSFVSSSNACSSRYREVFHQGGSSILADLSSVDGDGSGLDADTLDGLTSSSFASASDSSLLTTRVSELETETQDPHVLRVAATGGDYTSLATAIAAISDATVDNPYLVIVGPGSFSLAAPITIPSGVHVRGSGMYTTTITSTHSSSPVSAGCLINLSDGSSLSQLGIIASASTVISAAVCAASISASDLTDPATFQTRIDHVLIDVTGGGGTFHYGVYSNNADLLVSNSSITAANANVNYGIYFLASGSSRVSRVENTAVHSAANSSYGVLVSGSNQTTYVNGSNINGESVALYASSGHIQVAHSSVFSSTSYAMYASGATATIIANQIQIDGALNAGTASGGTVTCSFVSELATGAGHASTCS